MIKEYIIPQLYSWSIIRYIYRKLETETNIWRGAGTFDSRVVFTTFFIRRIIICLMFRAKSDYIETIKPAKFNCLRRCIDDFVLLEFILILNENFSRYYCYAWMWPNKMSLLSKTNTLKPNCFLSCPTSALKDRVIMFWQL